MDARGGSRVRLCTPFFAVRAQETSYRVGKELGISEKDIHFDRRLYAADVETLLAVLADCPKGRKNVMLVGHDPGMAELLAYLWGDQTVTPEDGNLMPTATLVRLKLPDDWARLEYGCGRTVSVTRPGSLPTETD